MTELDQTLAPDIVALIAELGIKRTFTRPGKKGMGQQVGPDSMFEATITPPQLESMRQADGSWTKQLVAYTSDVVQIGDKLADNGAEYDVGAVAEYRTGELVAARQLVLKR